MFDSLNVCFGFKKQLVDKIKAFMEILHKSINENAPDELRSGGIIKNGYNSQLDYYRNEIVQIENKISEEASK